MTQSTLELANHRNYTTGVMDALPIGVRNAQIKRRAIKTDSVSIIAWKETMITASDIDEEKN